MTSTPPWLAWARELQAISQTGLTFTADDYDRGRYRRLAEIAAEIVEKHAGLPVEPTVENFLVQPGYATPKVDVRGAIVVDGKVLLVQERADGRWALPGGWADVGDLPSETIVREVWEETGFQVVVSKLIGVYDGNRSGTPLSFYHAYKLVFLCEITGGAARPNEEILDVAFFDFEDLPPLSSERTNPRHLAEVRAHAGDPRGWRRLIEVVVGGSAYGKHQFVRRDCSHSCLQRDFIIGVDGLVTSSKIKATSMNSDPVESCISRRIKTLKFPSPGSGIVQVFYPFFFRVAGGQ